LLLAFCGRLPVLGVRTPRRSLCAHRSVAVSAVTSPVISCPFQGGSLLVCALIDRIVILEILSILSQKMTNSQCRGRLSSLLTLAAEYWMLDTKALRAH
jgi:hypothetical protein